MKRLITLVLIAVLVTGAYAQSRFDLHVQPGKTVMPGDGLDYTTLVVTARNAEGEIMTNISGRVKVGISSGFVDETEIPMNSGVAMVKFTAPMFGTPIKSSQRMVYFMFKFMEKFISRSSGSTDEMANRKLATGIALETFKEGLNPVTLLPKKNGENEVFIVCEMNGVKGKAKITISKETDSPNGNIIPGMYYGKDITGQSSWFLDISSGGQGLFGEASGSEQNANTILFTTESFKEFNDAMGKMAGMTGFMKAYLGPPESETKYLENYNIREMGMGSAYMPMPNNGVFVYIPPILFEYAGRKTEETQGGSDDTEKLKFEKTGIVFSQDKVVGDGRSRTKAVFHYEDENGLPVSGKTIRWEIPKGLKVLSVQTTTDATGNAMVELQVPVVKADGETRGDQGGLIENYALYPFKVHYTSLKEKNESTQATLVVYKTLEQDLYILKPGMELAPYKVLLPQLEYYNLESSIYALMPENYMTNTTVKIPVNDAMIFVGSSNFDKAEFMRLYDMYFKKDRKLFMTFLENEKGGFSALTDARGKFRLIIRDSEGKKRLYMGGYDRKVPLEPLEAKISDLTGRRKGALTEVLGLLSSGADASGNIAPDDGTFTGQGLNALDYKQKVYSQLFEMERVLCKGSHTEAMYLEEKLHIIGMLMTNAKGTARFMGDTGKEIIENGWELLGMVWEYANEKFKITEKLSQKVGLDKVGDSLARLGMKFELAAWSKVMGKDQKHGTHRIILEQIKKYVLASDAPNKNKASAAYYRMMGQAADAISGEVWDALTSGISDALSEANPIPDMIVDALRNKFYAGLRVEVDKFMAQPPEKIHAIYPQLQEALRDRSTEIRTYYQDIAASRFNFEMYKADVDLFRDVVVKGAIIIYDVKTLNWAKVKDHLEKLENFNKVTDAAYTATRFAQELWRYKNLWQEASAAFHFANRSVSQGVLVSEMPADEWHFRLFQEAYAARVSAGIPPAVSTLASADLSLRGSALPIEQINKVMAAGNAQTAWMDSQSERLTMLNGFQPEIAGKLYQSASGFDYELTHLVVSALAYAQEQSAQNRQAYESAAGKLKSAGTELAGIAEKTQSALDEIPESVTVPVEAVDNSTEVKPWDNPLYRKIAGGALAAVLLAFVIWWVLRRRRSRPSSVSQPDRQAAPPKPAPASPVSRPAAPVQQATPPVTPIPGPRFCPSCGNSLTPGARFCKQCGNKITDVFIKTAVMKYCNHCGNTLKPEARFCGKCGQQVTEDRKSAQDFRAPGTSCENCGFTLPQGIRFCTHCGAPAPADTRQNQPILASISSDVKGSDHGSDSTIKPGKKKKRMTWVLTGIVVILIAGFSAAGWYLLKNSEGVDNEEDIIRPEYAIHPVVSGTTTEETREVAVSAGNDAAVILSDSSGVFVKGLKGNAKITLRKETNKIRTGLPGVETSGYMLTLTLRTDSNNSALKPVITIPKSQVGNINPVTVNIVRVCDVYGSYGQIIRNKVQFLPVTRDKDGNYTALDYLFPFTAASSGQVSDAKPGLLKSLAGMLVPQARAQDNNFAPGFGVIKNVTYSISTFQGNLNWAKNPKLVQMTPAVNSTHFRRPSTVPERTKRTEPVVNIVVLVHGHNEEEKTGYEEKEIPDVWEYSYKKEVWDYIYKYYLDRKAKREQADKNKADNCTLFYEFIYPTYRPIFTPVPNGANKITPHRTLGEDLGEAINQKLLTENTQVAQMVKNNIPFNIYIVAHSMGGLVSRAGLRFLDERLIKNFRQLITWGSPHQGSPLMTLRYMMEAGFDVSIDGYAYYPDMYGDAPGWLAAKSVVDTPGTQDLRWTNGSAGVEKFFKYDNFFRENSVEKFENKEYDLRTGSRFYNDNLKAFNENEKFSDRFTFFTGNTTRIAAIHKGGYFSTRAYYMVKAKLTDGETAIGAYFIRLLAEDKKMKDNDGASPVYSQGGSGLFRRPKTVDMGDINHEEFYGTQGMTVAERTFSVMNETADCNCPHIQDYVQNGNTISARLIWPGLPNPAKSIKGIKVEITDSKSHEVLNSSDKFSFTDANGNFKGTISGSKEISGGMAITLKAETSAGSLIEYKSEFSGGQDFKLNYSRVEVRLYVQGMYLAYSNWDGNGFIPDENQMEQSRQNGLRDVGGVIRNESMFQAEWAALPAITWNGSNFSMQHKYQVMSNPAEERWDSFRISGVISGKAPRTVSGEAVYSMKNKLMDGTDGFQEKGIVFSNVPYNSVSESGLVFRFSSGDSHLSKYVIKYWNKDGGGQFKTEAGNIDWNRGGDIMVRFYNK